MENFCNKANIWPRSGLVSKGAPCQTTFGMEYSWLDGSEARPDRG